MYGELHNPEDFFTENTPYDPRSPYSASKAAAEMFILSYNKTYGIDYLITRSSNNYGERQYVEKLIPQIIYSLENNKKIPIHGDGSYIRDWIYVKDNVEAIYHLAISGIKNETFNISANNHMTNLEVVKQICNWYNIENFAQNVEFVPNRMGQDIRYSIDCGKIKKTGWIDADGKIHDWKDYSGPWLSSLARQKRYRKKTQQLRNCDVTVTGTPEIGQYVTLYLNDDNNSDSKSNCSDELE